MVSASSQNENSTEGDGPDYQDLSPQKNYFKVGRGTVNHGRNQPLHQAKRFSSQINVQVPVSGGVSSAMLAPEAQSLADIG